MELEVGLEASFDNMESRKVILEKSGRNKSGKYCVGNDEISRRILNRCYTT
jgi:hypothetical protein